jgi:hypothetical protein
MPATRVNVHSVQTGGKPSTPTSQGVKGYGPPVDHLEGGLPTSLSPSDVNGPCLYLWGSSTRYGHLAHPGRS